MDTGIFSHRVTLSYIDPRRDSDNEVLAHSSRQQFKYQLDWAMFGFDMDVARNIMEKGITTIPTNSPASSDVCRAIARWIFQPLILSPLT